MKDFFKNGVQNFGLNKCVSRHLMFGDFKFPKIVHHNKIIKRSEQQKIKKIPHNVLKKLSSQMNSQNFCKIELNSEKLELLKHSL